MIRRSRFTRRRYNGYTLLEMLITLIVSSILAGIAIPSLSSLLSSNRMTVSVNEFIAALYLARSEAIKRGQTVSICPSLDQSTCITTRDWKRGWIVFVEANQNSRRDADEQLIRVFGQKKNTMSLRSSRRPPVSFQHHGRSPGSNATFTFCDNRGVGAARAVILSNSGRYRVARTKTNGNALDCGKPG